MSTWWIGNCHIVKLKINNRRRQLLILPWFWVCLKLGKNYNQNQYVAWINLPGCHASFNGPWLKLWFCPTYELSHIVLELMVFSLNQDGRVTFHSKRNDLHKLWKGKNLTCSWWKDLMCFEGFDLKWIWKLQCLDLISGSKVEENLIISRELQAMFP